MGGSLSGPPWTVGEGVKSSLSGLKPDLTRSLPGLGPSPNSQFRTVPCAPYTQSAAAQPMESRFFMCVGVWVHVCVGARNRPPTHTDHCVQADTDHLDGFCAQWMWAQE